MSELKAYRIIQGDTGGFGAPSYKCDTNGNQIEEWSDASEVYDKYEADKVIAELKDKLRHYPIMAAIIEADKRELDELKAQKAQAEDDCAYWKAMAQKNAVKSAGG